MRIELLTSAEEFLVRTLSLRAADPFRTNILGGVATAVVPIWIYSMGFELSLPIVLVGAFIAGVAVEIFTVVWGTSMQTNIPEESRSRVMSYDAFDSYALAPIGIAFAGPCCQLDRNATNARHSREHRSGGCTASVDIEYLSEN